MFADAASDTSNPVTHEDEIEDACMLKKDPEPQHKICEIEHELLTLNEPPLREAREPFTMQP